MVVSLAVSSVSAARQIADFHERMITAMIVFNGTGIRSRVAHETRVRPPGGPPPLNTTPEALLADLIDTHCHLTFGKLGEDAEGAWQRARSEGVCAAVLVGIDGASSSQVCAHVSAKEDLFATVGIHPNSTAEATEEEWRTITALATEPRVVGIGETGIDLYRDRAEESVQRRWLLRHAELAIQVNKPLVLHLRQGFAPAIDALRPLASELNAVVHCFQGGPKDLEPFLEWGFWISYSGILTYPPNKELREAARITPPEQCVVETDAPWLTPVPHRGKQNEPAYLPATARVLAEAQGVSYEEVAASTTTSAKALFRLDRFEARAPSPA